MCSAIGGGRTKREGEIEKTTQKGNEGGGGERGKLRDGRREKGGNR